MAAPHVAVARPRDRSGPGCAGPSDQWLLPLYVLGVTLYLILPVVVMIAVQLQRPGRPVEPQCGRASRSMPG